MRLWEVGNCGCICDIMRKMCKLLLYFLLFVILTVVYSCRTIELLLLYLHICEFFSWDYEKLGTVANFFCCICDFYSSGRIISHELSD
jgi:hypothetical protein